MYHYLYDIFQTCGKNSCSDLNIALAMFLSDVREGKQQYGPDGLDYAALQQEYAALAAGEEELRSFLGRHYDALVKAYRAQDRAQFDAAVAACQAKDGAAQSEQE